MTINVARYLDRLGMSAAPPVSLAGLRELQQRHLMTVPFENLDVFLQRPVGVDPAVAVDKIVERGRGGWCFELNGAFAELLRSLDFNVLVLGAATLVEGPSDVVDHMMLEVRLDEPYLVDVGFGQHSPLEPLALNTVHHEHRNVSYELLASPKGTTLASITDGTPEALCRFKRVAHDFDEFAGASERLANDPDSLFRQRPFATRLLDDRGARLTWSNDELTRSVPGQPERVEPVDVDDRLAVLDRDFGIRGVPL